MDLTTTRTLVGNPAAGFALLVAGLLFTLPAEAYLNRSYSNLEADAR